MRQGISLRLLWSGLIVLVALAPMAILFPWLGSKAHALLLERALLRETQFNEEIKIHVDREVNRIITVLQNKSDSIAHTLGRHDR